MVFNYNIRPVDFVEGIEEFSRSKLRRKIDILRLYEEAQLHDNIKLFDELLFNAKYVMGLLRVVQSSTDLSEIKNIEQIKKDFSENMEKVINQLKEIIKPASPDLCRYFEDTYFQLTQENFIHISELLSDLEQAKKYTNSVKREV